MPDRISRTPVLVPATEYQLLVSDKYNTGKWRWTAGLTNLFNQKEYRQTTYSDIRSHASWMKIRPREMMVSVQYQW